MKVLLHLPPLNDGEASKDAVQAARARGRLAVWCRVITDSGLRSSESEQGEKAGGQISEQENRPFRAKRQKLALDTTPSIGC